MDIELSASPEDLQKRFFALQTSEDIAELLEIPYDYLIYYLYRVPFEHQYTTFFIPKKSGGTRKITAPISPLKIIQRKLNQVLQAVYIPKPSVHGFVPGRSIVTNAEAHMYKRIQKKKSQKVEKPRNYILNIDLEDFFPSINFGRVRGMFMAVPYKCPERVATVLAQICCAYNELPQGAPTSPIVSNMLCSKLDSQLQRLAQKYRCHYTRYADDITFSTSLLSFPRALATTEYSSQSGYQVVVGPELNVIVEENGFRINRQKVRLQTPDRRQEITGLTVNEFPNVRRQYINQIRAMLYAWKKFGHDNAEERYRELHDNQEYQCPDKLLPSFRSIVRGKIEFLGMVRGKQDRTYLRFLEKLAEVDPEFRANWEMNKIKKGGTNKQVFISYSRKDEDFARKLVNALSNRNIGAWLDVNEISPGENWVNVIQNGLVVCELMLVIISPDSMSSSQVAEEWQYFLSQSKPVIPLLYKNTNTIPYKLDTKQRIDFQEHYEFDSAMDILLRALNRENIASN
ncbi:MAG: TIR domain-containing protein [Anaerolineae bacterium]|nr:TIR domain-containing protein [Anaerolineae bacterium]